MRLVNYNKLEINNLKRLASFAKLSLFVLVISCKRETIPVDPGFQQKVVDAFFIKYRKFQKETLPACHDNNRDIAFDIERKIRSIQSIPYAGAFRALWGVLGKEKRTVDTIVMCNIHSPLFEPEFSYPPIYFCLKMSDKTQKNIIVDIDSEMKCSAHLLPESSTLDWVNFPQKDGCGYGYVFFVTFNKKMQIVKTDFIINPDE